MHKVQPAQVKPDTCYMWSTTTPHDNIYLQETADLTVGLGHTLDLILLLDGVTAQHQHAELTVLDITDCTSQLIGDKTHTTVHTF